jgi:hypothetical protein
MRSNVLQEMATSMSVARGAIILATCGALGCSDPSPPSVDTNDAGGVGCQLAFLGSASKAPELEVLVLGTDGVSTPLVDGGTVPLVTPPQGGRVVFLGVRATNMDPCAVKLTGAIRDPATKQVRIDGRTINLAPVGDGYGVSVDSDIATFANVPVCPNEWASTDAYDHSFEVELTLVDRGGREATSSALVTPKCAEPQNAAECACICKQGYILGESCYADANSSSGGGSTP